MKIKHPWIAAVSFIAGAVLATLAMRAHSAPLIIASSDRLAVGQHVVLTHDLCWGRNQAPGVYVWQSFMGGMVIDQGCYTIDRDGVWPIGLPWAWQKRDFDWFDK